MSELYTTKALSPLRKVIAARMTEAKQAIPHYRLVADLEMDSLLAWRQHANEARSEVKISVNDCIIKACALALMKHPDINSQFVDPEIHQYRQADISVVTAIEGGLSTPIVRAADRKSIRDIAVEVKTLALRAAAGQLKMSEILGGSFSISNLGGHGVVQFDAIINPPQCAILAVGCARKRMMISDEGDTRVATVLRATLSVDHRVIDGAAAAVFLATLQQILRRPQDLFEQ